MNYKIGDRVFVRKGQLSQYSGHATAVGRIGIADKFQSLEHIHITMETKEKFDSTGYGFDSRSTAKEKIEECLIKMEDIMDNLQQGDIITNNINEDRLEIQGKIGKVYVTLALEDNVSYTYSAKELEDSNYQLEVAEPEITEVTLEEVAKLKGIPVEQLRIKE